jgi:hypothetical protein
MSSESHAGKVVYEVVQDPRPEAIVVHCSDPRFQCAFGQFIEQELGLPKGKYIPLVVGGGAGPLARPELLPKEFKFLKERFELHREHHASLRRIILINHEDCGYYKSLNDKIAGFVTAHFKAVAHQPREDLALVAKVFSRLLSHLGFTVEFYYARFVDEAQCKIVFEKLGV